MSYTRTLALQIAVNINKILPNSSNLLKNGLTNLWESRAWLEIIFEPMEDNFKFLTFPINLLLRGFLKSAVVIVVLIFEFRKSIFEFKRIDDSLKVEICTLLGLSNVKLTGRI